MTKKMIVHFINKPFANITLCGINVHNQIHGTFSSLDEDNINCEKCLKMLKQQG